MEFQFGLKYEIPDTEEQREFLLVLTEYFCDFLGNVKVADNSIPIATVEKVSDMMSKLRDDCLSPLGTALIKREHVRIQLQKEYLWSKYCVFWYH